MKKKYGLIKKVWTPKLIYGLLKQRRGLIYIYGLLKRGRGIIYIYGLLQRGRGRTKTSFKNPSRFRTCTQNVLNFFVIKVALQWELCR